jgi:hypothetical protein
MASQSETSFGAKLRKAQDILAYITNFQNYAPPRTQESVAGFVQLITDIIATNTAETTQQQSYNANVTTRFFAFRKDDDCAFKRLAPIRAAVEAQFGKKSIEFNQVDTIVKQIRASKLIKFPATANSTEHALSQSEQSYGSTTQYFTDLVDTLGTLNNYNPTNTAIQITELINFKDNLNKLNTKVAIEFQGLKIARKSRRDLYADLSERVARIKAYVKATYGTQSQEYALIKGFKI